MILSNCTISGDTATGDNDSGGIFSYDGTLTASNCTISGNAGDKAGGIFSYLGQFLTVTGSTISGNLATGDGGSGGAIYAYVDSQATVTDSTIFRKLGQPRGRNLRSGRTDPDQ